MTDPAVVCLLLHARNLSLAPFATANGVPLSFAPDPLPFSERVVVTLPERVRGAPRLLLRFSFLRHGPDCCRDLTPARACWAHSLSVIKNEFVHQQVYLLFGPPPAHKSPCGRCPRAQ